MSLNILSETKISTTENIRAEDSLAASSARLVNPNESKDTPIRAEESLAASSARLVNPNESKDTPIRAEESPAASSARLVNPNESKDTPIRAEEALAASAARLADPYESKDTQVELLKCICELHDETSKVKISPTHVEEILREKEMALREEYERILQKEKQQIKDRYNLVLLNEQSRASYMLRQAHRERQEKIHALKTQLQCKNLAALMYVMCTERKRSRFEKLQIIEDYTNYINVLNGILTKGQQLILHLSRGYKTAARVDHEWREKMKKVVSQFMSFIYHFAGGAPETNQYLIDLPKLLKTNAPIDINPDEDPCDCDDDKLDELPKEMPRFGNREWWEDLDAENSPFIMFGDMADFEPNQRREVLKSLKAQKIKPKKTAPKEWKELAFKDMFLKSKCVHLDKIKSMYKDKLPTPMKWECFQSPGNGDLIGNSKVSIPASNRGVSVDMRGTMGSILKIIALGPTSGPFPAKQELLGARDSLEITSMTKVRMSIKPDTPHQYPDENIVLDIGRKKASLFRANDDDDEDPTIDLRQPVSATRNSASSAQNDVSNDVLSVLGSLHTDSLQIIHSRHPPEQDHTINYERVCPMEKCQRLQVDSFMRSLPPYMRANPFTHFQQTFEEYETCSPEQLEMLKKRIEHRMTKESRHDREAKSGRESPLSEWFSTGVAVQTSASDMLPPCSCHDQPPKSPVRRDFVFDMSHLELVKVAMDAIQKECLFSDKIEFNRFKLIGKDSKEQKPQQKQTDAEFKQSRYQDISEILNQHPSLLDIFQANAK